MKTGIESCVRFGNCFVYSGSEACNGDCELFYDKNNRWETLCREWIKGCSCSSHGKPSRCQECTEAFLSAVIEHAQEIKAPEFNEHVVGTMSQKDIVRAVSIQPSEPLPFETEGFTMTFKNGKKYIYGSLTKEQPNEQFIQSPFGYRTFREEN